MSTLKSDSIQPVSNGNNLIFKTGVGDLERMRIQPNGKFVINNARADVGAGSVLTGRGALGTIHFVQNDANDTWVGMTTSSNTTSSTSQGGILIQGSHGYGTKIHFLTTESYAEGQKNRMTLDNFGSLGIGTSTPGASLDVNGTIRASGGVTFDGTSDHTGVARFASGVTFAGTTDHTGVARFAAGVTMSSSLDVNGTLKVGNFGGATNVMIKPKNTGPGTVGYTQPFYFASTVHVASAITSNGIPEGTWFVYGQWVENSNTVVDNDPTIFMAKIWTVPTGQFLHIASDNQLWSVTDSGNGGPINLHWKYSTSAIQNISGAKTTWGTGWNTFVIPPNNNPNQTSDVIVSSINYGPPTAMSIDFSVYGYAQPDTYGVRGLGNNTTLGPGYGYITRIA